MGKRKKRTYVPKVKGCYECSQRRVNCDKAEPVCGKCQSRGIACSGYGIRYRFRRDSTLAYQDGKTAKAHVSPQNTHIGSGFSTQPDRSNFPALEDLAPRSRLGLDHRALSSSPRKSMQGVGGGSDNGLAQSGSLSPDHTPEPCHALVNCTGLETKASSTTWAPSEPAFRLSTLGYLDAWKEALLNHFSEKIAPEMVVVDDRHNGWRRLLLPIARTDDLVLDAVLAASAFHSSECGSLPLALVDPHRLYSRVIRKLQTRNELLEFDTQTKQAVVLSIIVLLVVVMINGCSDFPIIFNMLQSALDAIGGEKGIEDGGEVGDFSLRQIHKMRVYAAPLLSQYDGMQVIVSQSETSFDCLHYYDRLYPSFSTLFGSIAALRQQAFDIYLDRVLQGNGCTTSNEDAIGRFVETLKSLPDSSTGKHALVWPCFIAASGSRRPENQAVLKEFLEGQYHRNGFVNLQKALELLTTIWTCDPNQNEDWPSLLPKPQVFIM